MAGQRLCIWRSAEQAVLDARQTARGEQGALNLGCVSSAMFDGRLPAQKRFARGRQG
jgi:hypothetical protein